MKHYYAYLPAAEGTRFLVKASSESQVRAQVRKHYEESEFEEESIHNMTDGMTIEELDESFFTNKEPDALMLE